MIRKSVRFGFCKQDTKTFDNLCTAADDTLFKALCANRDHVLHKLLGAQHRERVYNLRARAHCYYSTLQIVMPHRLYLYDKNSY